MARVAIFGAGGHAKVVWDILVASGHEVAGFVVDEPQARTFLDLPVATDFRALPPHDGVVVAFGDNPGRKARYEAFCAAGLRVVSAIHPSAVIAGRVALGDGVMIAAGVVINLDSVIGANSIINTGATVDHDNHVGAHAHIAPGCHLACGVTLGEGAFLGIGTNVIPNRTIGAWARTGAGAVVVRDLPDGVLAVGVPARPVPASAEV